MKTLNLVCSCLAFLSLASCSSSSGGTSGGATNTSKTNGASAIRSHLDAKGTGSYHDVSTGTNSTLGYSGANFFVGSYAVTSSLVSSAAVVFSFGSTEGTAALVIKSGSMTTYSATYACYTSNHVYSSIDVTAISVCVYSSKSDLTSIAQISIYAIELAVNAASRYLSSNGLPYIY